MIAKLTGLIDSLHDTFLVLDVKGVGYLVSCSSRTLGTIGNTGDPATLFIETVMKETSLSLYGFSTTHEQACFRLLITVQGVGMRMAMALLSALSPVDIYQAIGTQDKDSSTRADGVGPKLASRIMGELKDKIPENTHFITTPYAPSSAQGPNLEDATSALVNLGYRRIDAITAVSKAQSHVNDDAPLSELIRKSLSLLERSGT